MKGLEELLGFRITGTPDSCIDHRRIELLDSVTGNIKATRPATHQEVDLWNALQDHTFALEAANAGAKEVADNNAQLLADNRSLKASCNAYQEQLQKLRVYVEANWVSPVLPPRTVPTLDMFAEIIQSHNAQKKRLLDKAREIWQIEPGTDIIDFVFRQLQHLNGEMAVETERRRMEHITRKHFPEDPMNSVLAEELEKMQHRTAGRPVRDNPQA